MAEVYLAGKSGSVKIGMVSYAFSKWKCAMKANLSKITNFKSGGYQALLSAIVGATITLSGPYGSTAMGFTVGNSYTWLLHFSDDLNLSVPGIIESIEPDVDVEGHASVNLTIQSTGTFTAAIT